MSTEKQTTGRPTRVDVIDQDGFWLDDEKGSGSRDETEDWIDEHALVANDGRSETRTVVGYTDEMSTTPSDEKQHRLHRLRKINDGVGESSRKQQNNDAEVRRDAHTYANYLGFTDYQRDRVLHIISEMDYSSQHLGPWSVEKVIIAVCSLVHDEETTSFSNRASSHDRFHDLMDSIDADGEMTTHELKRLREHIREKTRFF